jgi:hypothetical protein
VARFEVSHRKAGVNTANTIMWQHRTTASSRVRIYEIALAVDTVTTTGPSWRLNRTTAVGTSTATVSPEEQDPGGGAATSLLDITWSSNPTLGSNDLRRYATPQTVGSGIVWTWPDHRPLIIPASAGMAIVNGNATGASTGFFVVTFVFEE